MMTLLEKSQRIVETAVGTSMNRALQMKADGVIGGSLAPADTFGFGRWAEQSKYKERFAQFRGTVYSAINATSLHACKADTKVASVKGKEKEKKPRGRKALLLKSMPTSMRSKAAESELEVHEDHPLKKLLEKPNPFQGRLQFVYSFIANINLTGKGYIVGGVGEDDQMELYALPSSWVTPQYDKGKLTGWKVGDPGKPIVQHEELKPNQVVCAYMPDPSDPRGSLAPAASQSPAIRVNDKIWASREMFFENGIYPGSIVTVGTDPHPDAGGKRPRLTAGQRRQVNAAIKSVMAGVANHGNPAIIDGLIEKIERLSMTSEEMGWEKSAAETKAAILSTFCCHPYILGEYVPGSFAQAKNIMELFYGRVNVFLDMLGNAVTTLINALGGDEELLVWWEPLEYSDEESRWKKMMDLRRNNDITQNELRAEAGLPPDEDDSEDVVGTHAQHVIALLEKKGSGAITRDQCFAVLKGMGFAEDIAEDMAGEEIEPPEKAPETPPGAVPPGAEGKPLKPGEGPQTPSSGPQSPLEPEEELLAAAKALRSVPRDVSSRVAAMICKAAEMRS
jgi:phage portal protein BeeE